MKFVALISGGKDSCYNVVKCLENGHELTCLANLCPPTTFQGEELNSFMYQSAAYNTIPLMAECFDRPLIRKEITGKAVQQSLHYEANQNLLSGTSPNFDTKHNETISPETTAYNSSEGNANNSIACGEHDEVEDLYELLLEVKEHFPDIQVCPIHNNSIYEF